MNWLHEAWWKLFGNRRLAAKLNALTLPQLNLIEAQCREHYGELPPALETVFAQLRQEKSA